MRTTKQLLEVLLEHQNLFERGLCAWVENLYFRKVISSEECTFLGLYIKHNRPNKYSSLECFKQRGSVFYWKVGNLAPRIKWIKKHIKKLS